MDIVEEARSKQDAIRFVLTTLREPNELQQQVALNMVKIFHLTVEDLFEYTRWHSVPERKTP